MYVTIFVFVEIFYFVNADTQSHCVSRDPPHSSRSTVTLSQKLLLFSFFFFFFLAHSSRRLLIEIVILSSRRIVNRLESDSLPEIHFSLAVEKATANQSLSLLAYIAKIIEISWRASKFFLQNIRVVFLIEECKFLFVFFFPVASGRRTTISGIAAAEEMIYYRR